MDEDYLANNLDISNTSSNVLTALNKDNSLVNLVNNLHNRRRNLEEVKSTQAPTLNSALDSNSLSFSLSRQSILYDAYCLGSEKKIASLIVGQSFYTSPAEAQTVASTEEIDTELEKIKELFAAGFIQQGKPT